MFHLNFTIMKKSILMLALMVSVGLISYAQTTNYGTSSGTLGTNNSFFGAFSGNAATASSNNNAFFGYESGKQITTGYSNVAIGYRAFYSSTNGGNNVAIGYRALYSNTSGNSNVGIGYNALSSTTTGGANTAMGTSALLTNSTGSYNSAFGYQALLNSTTASENTAVGYRSLYSNQHGTFNTAIGNQALQSNVGGESNVAIGYKALYSNVSGNENIAIGQNALFSNTYGLSVAIGHNALQNANTSIVGRNVAVGNRALQNTTSGYRNVGIGNSILFYNTTGSLNTATGIYALNANTTGNNNSAFGDGALGQNTIGNNNSAFGSGSGPNSANLSNTTALGANTIVYSSNHVRVGDPFVTSIGGYDVFVDVSDSRFKKDIKEEVPGLSFINQLRPVNYILDRIAIAKFLGMPDSVIRDREVSLERKTGFIAQEVEEIINKGGLVFDGVESPRHEKEHYGIRYARFVVPLVKAVQELSAKVEEQQQKIDALLLKGDSTGRSEGNSTGIILYDNNPNPFSTETEIKLRLPESTKQATVVVYNMEGTQLKSLTVNTRGETSVKISSNELKAGMYLYSLIADGKFIDTKRMILTK
jgi:hypothetical protein